MHLQTLPPLCVQVIMIECADLKNVINYQEVEALKHTIKVHRGRGTRVWLDSRRVNRCNNLKKSLPCRFYLSSSGGALRAMSCHLSFGNRWSTTCQLNAERHCPDARYAAFNIDQKDCFYLCQGGYVFSFVCWFVGWLVGWLVGFVSRFTQKLRYRFAWNFGGGCYSNQE